MLRDGSVAVDGSWTGEERDAWRDVDRQLRRAARRRARLDHEELVLIRAAIAVQVWRPLGMVSMRDYLENVFGYGPTVATERIRVAEALDAMPALDRALHQSVLPYSAVREISRIATRATEGEWVDACRGKNVRQIEELLAEREPGDRPSSPRKPDAGLRDVRWRVRPGVWAKLRTTKRALETACGERLDDSAFADAMCDAVMALMTQDRRAGSGPTDAGHSVGARGAVADAPCAEGSADVSASSEAACEGSAAAAAAPAASTRVARMAGRARYQITVTICRACGVTRQEAAGVHVALSSAEVERAMCDAEHVDERGHAKQDIPPATRKLVRLRDGERCTVPGCRSAQFLELHHIDPLSEGGGHEPENLTTLCGAHHDARHDGRLIIRGRAPNLVFEWTVPRSHVEELDDEDEVVNEQDGQGVFHVEVPRVSAAMRADAELALTTLGYKRGVSHAAVERACARVDAGCDLEALIRAALQCVTPG